MQQGGVDKPKIDPGHNSHTYLSVTSSISRGVNSPQWKSQIPLDYGEASPDTPILNTLNAFPSEPHHVAKKIFKDAFPCPY